MGQWRDMVRLLLHAAIAVPIRATIIRDPLRRYCSFGWKAAPITATKRTRAATHQPWGLTRPSPTIRYLSQRDEANPTEEWKGASYSSSSSSFASHVLVQPDESPIELVHVVDRVLTRLRKNQTIDASSVTAVTDLLATDLIELGSVWFLPAAAPRDPASGVKPTRVTRVDMVLDTGDYVRIHHDPRRFPAVHDYDWTMLTSVSGTDDTVRRPGVVVASNADKGWVVVDKPAGVPVHMTVDNAKENVAACLYQAAVAQRHNETIYVATPQRLDQNTSGLLVVATSKVFAAYFAQLLRLKTAQLLLQSSSPTVAVSSDVEPNTRVNVGGVHKRYKCLVCLLPPDSVDKASSEGNNQPWSVLSATADLQSYVTQDSVMRHYLEPSIRAPKRFVLDVPSTVTVNASAAQWAESLLKIRNVSSLYVLVGNDAAVQLAESLRASSSLPRQCQAVLELEIELLTGRTHQIRGQLAACRYPLVGDMQYGGAEQNDEPLESPTSEQLALQCCALDFVDPDMTTGPDGEISMVRSDRWNRFCIDRAWWTPMLEKYDAQLSTLSAECATTSINDAVLVDRHSGNEPASRPTRSDLLPPRVSLSPGKYKYVLLRAVHPSTPDTIEWFVKSAAPHECGGPYHGNVAQDLREWVAAAGYNVTVTGGGRIDYRAQEGNANGQATVFGFSYGFGKGDHEKAAAIISNWSQGRIDILVDNSPNLY